MFLQTTMIHHYISSFFLVLVLSTQAFAEDKEIANLFINKNVTGTMVISSLKNSQTFIHNDSRAEHRFTVASTFKILNTLIALEEKIISDKNDVFKWNGDVHSIPNWNSNQTLESAFKVSCVWCFQELARSIGSKKYQNYLDSFSYGKLYEPFTIDTFWLDGSLKISAIEQIEFLKKVYQRTLSFHGSSYEVLSQIMLVEKTLAYTLHAKSGLAVNKEPKIGWYVGYIELFNDTWFFAINIDVIDDKFLPLRSLLIYEALKIKGIIK